jgi:hypothetical protein
MRYNGSWGLMLAGAVGFGALVGWWILASFPESQPRRLPAEAGTD